MKKTDVERIHRRQWLTAAAALGVAPNLLTGCAGTSDAPGGGQQAQAHTAEQGGRGRERHPGIIAVVRPGGGRPGRQRGRTVVMTDESATMTGQSVR